LCQNSEIALVDALKFETQRHKEIKAQRHEVHNLRLCVLVFYLSCRSIAISGVAGCEGHPALRAPNHQKFFASFFPKKKTSFLQLADALRSKNLLFLKKKKQKNF